MIVSRAQRHIVRVQSPARHRYGPAPLDRMVPQPTLQRVHIDRGAGRPIDHPAPHGGGCVERAVPLRPPPARIETVGVDFEIPADLGVPSDPAARGRPSSQGADQQRLQVQTRLVQPTGQRDVRGRQRIRLQRPVETDLQCIQRPVQFERPAGTRPRAGSIHRSIHGSIRRPVHRPVHRSIHRSIRGSIRRPIHRSVHRPIHRSVHRSIHRSVRGPSQIDPLGHQVEFGRRIGRPDLPGARYRERGRERMREAQSAGRVPAHGAGAAKSHLGGDGLRIPGERAGDRGLAGGRDRRRRAHLPVAYPVRRLQRRNEVELRPRRRPPRPEPALGTLNHRCSDEWPEEAVPLCDGFEAGFVPERHGGVGGGGERREYARPQDHPLGVAARGELPRQGGIRCGHGPPARGQLEWQRR